MRVSRSRACKAHGIGAEFVSVAIAKAAEIMVRVKLITFRVSRRPREMYCGHSPLCVWLCVCLSVCPRPHAHTIARTRL